MKRETKQQVVDEVRASLGESQVAIATHYRGLTVTEMTELRRRMRVAGAGYRVVKNTLAKRALEGTAFAPLGPLLTGPTGLAVSRDPVAPAKVLADFVKDHPNLVIRGGVMGGRLLSEGDVSALAALPSREVLLSRLLGTLNAPIQNLVGVLAALPGGLVRVLGQIRDSKEKAA
ncbi:MAG: 50S ribosomal protein L10 [Magnetococcales bacterium]|nr:50S ribosomal protein L10 [Magnetococcales bacterium]